MLQEGWALKGAGKCGRLFICGYKTIEAKELRGPHGPARASFVLKEGWKGKLELNPRGDGVVSITDGSDHGCFPTTKEETDLCLQTTAPPRTCSTYTLVCHGSTFLMSLKCPHSLA